MEFLKTFLPAFLIWQSFSLCPFVLTKDSLKPKLNQFHSYLSMSSIIIQLAALVYGVIYYKQYTSISDRSIVIFVADILSMAFIRCIAVVIVIESWLKRSDQIDFLKQINRIDQIICTKMLIDLQFERQQKQNLREFFMWIGFLLSLELSVLLMTNLLSMKLLQNYLGFYTLPLFICMMRYHQFVSYVNLLCVRFSVLNDCIEQLKSTKYHNSTDLNYLNRSSKFFSRFSRFRHATTAKNVETSLIVNQLKHIQSVYRLLIDANQMLCKLFNWSMLLNVGNDFFILIINAYWLIDNAIQNHSKLEWIGIGAWAIFNVIMLTSVANACQLTSDEVIFDLIQK